MNLPAEGWYKDPYGHQDRWFSDGWPTNLVRDGDVTSYADPPDNLPHFGRLTHSDPGPQAPTPSDLHRADEACDDPPFDKKKAARAAWDVFDRSSSGGGI